MSFCAFSRVGRARQVWGNLWWLRSCSSSAGEVAARDVRSNAGHCFWSPLLTVLSQCFASVSAAFGEVPLLQFIDEWWLLQLLLKSGITVQTVAQTGDSMVQFWMVVDMHVAVQMTGLWFRQCITAVFRSCGALSRLSMSFAVHRQGVAVPVILQGPEIPWCSFGWSSTCPLVCKRQVVDVPAVVVHRQVVDVLVIMHVDGVLQLDVPQIPFIDRVVDISVAPQCLLCRTPEIPWCSYWDGRRHARWFANDRAMVQTVQKTVASAGAVL